jgi:hypothetical protein
MKERAFDAIDAVFGGLLYAWGLALLVLAETMGGPKAAGGCLIVMLVGYLIGKRRAQNQYIRELREIRDAVRRKTGIDT